MMLKTYCRKINPAVNMYFASVRRLLPLIIIASAAFLLVCPGYFFSNPHMYRIYENDIVDSGLNFLSYKYDLKAMIITLSVISGIFATFAPIVVNIINFSFLFSKKSSDFYFPLPLKRTELLISRTLAGLTVTFIPLLVSYSTLAVLSVVLPHNEGSILNVLMCFAYVVVAMLLSSAISLLFICCAGAVGDFIISFFGVNLGIFAVGGIISFLLSNSLWGYSMGSIAQLFKLLSPPFYWVYGFVDYFDNSMTYDISDLYFIRNIVVIAAFYALSIVLFKKRKAEKGGQGYAFFFMYAICSVIASFCAAFLIGIMFSLGQLDIRYFLFGLIGAVGISILFGAITYRGFRTVWRSVIMGSISWGIMLSIVIVSHFGAFGYVYYVPAVDNIESVEVTWDYEKIPVEDAELVTNLHKAILENKSNFEILYDDNAVYDYDGGYYYEEFEFSYRLKNGNVVSRSYRVDPKYLEEEYGKLIANTARFDRIVDNMYESQTDYVMIDLGYYDSYNKCEHREIYTIEISQAIEFLEIFRQELENNPLPNERGDGVDINFDNNKEYYDGYEEYFDTYYIFNVDLDEGFEESVYYLSQFPAETEDYYD